MLTSITLAAIVALAGAPAEINNHDVEATLDLQKHLIRITNTISVQTNGQDHLFAFFNKNMRIKSISHEGGKVEFRWAQPDEIPAEFIETKSEDFDLESGDS